MELEQRISQLRSRITDMYLRLGYNASGTRRINSQRVEEKSNIAEVDQTKENELAALKRALTAKR